MKHSIVIIHFQPIELYPPVLNLINFIADKKPRAKTYILTSKPSDRNIKPFTIDEKNIRIIASRRFGKNDSRIKKALDYIFFYAVCLFHLVFKRPGKIFYIETLSSFPVYWYKKYIKKNAAVFVHYHEYTSPTEYQDGMALSRIFHRYEGYLLSRASWVSHTNEKRMKRFMNDILPVKMNKPHILPNYPSIKWLRVAKTKKISDTKRVVYVGALGMQSMYIREFAEWVEAQNGKVIWDIYSQQNADELLTFLSSIAAVHTHFKGMLNYYDLPGVLSDYDVGVILYKGHSPNYIYNAPNKLFEYLACDLDVWFPAQMEGSKPYVTQGVFPKVVALDFEKLDKEIKGDIFLRKDMEYRKPLYYCENVLPALIEELYSNVG